MGIRGRGCSSWSTFCLHLFNLNTMSDTLVGGHWPGSGPVVKQGAGRGEDWRVGRGRGCPSCSTVPLCPPSAENTPPHCRRCHHVTKLDCQPLPFCPWSAENTPLPARNQEYSSATTKPRILLRIAAAATYPKCCHHVTDLEKACQSFAESQKVWQADWCVVV